MIVMPRSRSIALLSMTRSATCWFSRKMWLCLSMPSTSVVFPWSTCAMIAMLRMSSRFTSTPVSMHAEDVPHALEPREHPRELLDAGDLQRRVDRRGLVGIGRRGERDERDLVLADDRRDVTQESVAVPALDADGDRIRACRGE